VWRTMRLMLMYRWYMNGICHPYSTPFSLFLFLLLHPLNIPNADSFSLPTKSILKCLLVELVVVAVEAALAVVALQPVGLPSAAAVLPAVVLLAAPGLPFAVVLAEDVVVLAEDVAVLSRSRVVSRSRVIYRRSVCLAQD
jgi:hypothetical protein